jgi:hypothetical protein
VALRAAAARHAELAGLASRGQGCDRHLYALRAIAAEKGGAG